MKICDEGEVYIGMNFIRFYYIDLFITVLYLRYIHEIKSTNKSFREI